MSAERNEAVFPAEALARWRTLEWELIAPSPEPPPMNLALDEVLTKEVGRGNRGATLRFWAWSAPCVVIGRFQSVRNEVELEAAEELGVEVVRRISGGGAMFIEPANAITWSIHVPPDFVSGMSFPESYAFLDSWVVDALRELGIDAWYAPLNDITSAGGKIGGAAQARRWGGVLHHTTMAYDMSSSNMLRVLRIGKEKLSDKGLRSAEKRVGPLRLQTNLPRETIVEHMTSRFIAITGARPGQVATAERDEAAELVATKFIRPEWTHLLP